MTEGDEARRRLVSRAREELPRPGDPRRLIEDLRDLGAEGPEALEVLSRTILAWQQLRDLRLEQLWQGGYGWFLARNVMIIGLLVLVVTLVYRPPMSFVQGVLIGTGAYYLVVLALSPLRLRRHGARRRGIEQSYGEDLGAYLDSLETGKRD